MSTFSALDEVLQRTIGIAYLLATRDNSIHERLAYLVQILQEFAGSSRFRVLDVGCGGGMALHYLSRFASENISFYAGIDKHTARLRRRYANIRVEHSFYDIDLDSDWNVGEFDFAWCSEVLEHLIDDKGVFSKICRSVRSGGYVAVTMPSKSNIEAVGRTFPRILETSPRQDGGHVRVGYTSEDLVNILTETPGKLIRIDAVTRADEVYYRAHHDKVGAMRVMNNVMNALRRREIDHFEITNGGLPNLEKYSSIVGIYRIK